MTKEQFAILKNKLLQVRRQLLAGVDEVKKHSNDEFQDEAPDVNDEASRTYSRQVMLSLGEVERQTLKLVDDASKAMENGSYGTCVDCEDNIPYKRLEAVPYVKRCVACKEKWEEEVQTGG